MIALAPDLDARRRSLDWAQAAGATLLVAAVLFNAALAAINAHVTALTPAAVIAAEAGLVFAANAVALARYRAEMAPWYALLGCLALAGLVRSAIMQEVDPKFFRDVALIPTFVLLGMTFDVRRLTAVVIVIHAIVLGFLIFEAVDTERFSALFEIKSYYIGTRGYEAAAFWDTESDLFANATRPDGRFFSFVPLHRLSSVFLEPVSLGNYVIVVVAFLAARWREIGGFARAFFALGAIAMMLGSDSRLAAVTTLLFAVLWKPAHSVSGRVAWLYLPAVLVAAFTYVGLSGIRLGADDFSGRVAHGVVLLQTFDLAEFLGASKMFLDKAVDSGLAYLVTTQSLAAVVVLWTFITFAARDETAEQRCYTHATAIYIAVSMLVTYSFLSIKTASLLWFVRGSLDAARTFGTLHAPGRFEARCINCGRDRDAFTHRRNAGPDSAA